jgi:hypothetical protein
VEGGPGCIGALVASVIGGVIGVLTLGLDGLSILLVLVGMWWTFTVAGVLTGGIFDFKGDTSVLSEGLGLAIGVVPWVGLWLVAERTSRDTAFTVLAGFRMPDAPRSRRSAE